jgi:hypothetical protein
MLTISHYTILCRLFSVWKLGLQLKPRQAVSWDLFLGPVIVRRYAR